MSVHVLSWVLKHSEARLGDRLVLLVLADHAKEDGTGAWPSHETIAAEARLTARQVRRCLANLEQRGDIVRQAVSRAGTVIYAIQVGADNLSAVKLSPRTSTTPDVSEMSYEPSLNRPTERERASAPVKIAGKPVNPAAWDLTARVLTEFNAQADRKLRLLTSAGLPSDAAKRVYGRIRDYPDLSFDEHTDIICRTLTSHWWGDSAPSIGVVFGPKVFEENITRPALAARQAGTATVSQGDALIAEALSGRAA